MVIWIIGLAGSGKTTLGTSLYNCLKLSNPSTVFVDGDVVRKIFNPNESEHSYTLNGRRLNSERITQLCYWLDMQNINVICSIQSIFPEHQLRNRTLYSSYFEIFLRCPMDSLVKRRPLYKKAIDGQIQNIVGVDIPFPCPANPDLVIDTENTLSKTEVFVTQILNSIQV